MTTTDALFYVKANGIKYFGFSNGQTDGTETEVKLRDDGGGTRSIGEALEGRTLEEVAIQLSDGSDLTTAKLYDDNGGVILSFMGGDRTLRDPLWNVRVIDLNVPIARGTVLKLNTGD